MIPKLLQAYDDWFFPMRDNLWNGIEKLVSKYWDWILLGGYRRVIALIVFCSLLISIKWICERIGKWLKR